MNLKDSPEGEGFTPIVVTINAALSDEVAVSGAAALACNREPQVVFNGQYPRHSGFKLTPDEAKDFLSQEPASADVLFPFLVGQVMLTKDQPNEWVIDFQRRNIVDSQVYRLPFQRLTETVLPHIEKLATVERKRTGKESGQDQNWLRTWWQHFRCRSEMLDAIGDSARYIACSGVTKRPIFCFVSSGIRADHALFAFALDDDYSFGIMQSNAHWQWFVANCSKFKSDFRYTPESVFDTFPGRKRPPPNS